MTVLRSARLENEGLVHGMSTRGFGTMMDEENRERFLVSLGVDPSTLVRLGQVHGADLQRVGTGDGGTEIADADGAWSATGEIALSVRTADCFPVILFDPKRPAVALIHAGWRGVEKGIVGRGVEALTSNGSKASDILSWIGAGISSCCFEVKEDVASRFPAYVARRDGKTYVDLVAAIRDDLLNRTIDASRVETVGVCTACSTGKFYSHRRENSAAGRMLTVARLAE